MAIERGIHCGNALALEAFFQPMRSFDLEAPSRCLLCALRLGLLLVLWQPLSSHVLNNLRMMELSRVLVDSLARHCLKYPGRAASLLQQTSSLDPGNPSAHRGLAWIATWWMRLALMTSLFLHARDNSWIGEHGR